MLNEWPYIYHLFTQYTILYELDIGIYNLLINIDRGLTIFDYNLFIIFGDGPTY